MPSFHFSLSAISRARREARDVPRVEIAVADDLDPIDPVDLLADQLEDRGAEVAGDPAVFAGVLQPVLEEHVGQPAEPRAEPAQERKSSPSGHALAPEPFVLDPAKENPGGLCFCGALAFALGRDVSGHRHQVFAAR